PPVAVHGGAPVTNTAEDGGWWRYPGHRCGGGRRSSGVDR
ncbi:hypothetical protein A2U01_0114098, partial [Trifolium medium]|nr:hypothetical protein [Trifolium medium]